MSNVPSMKTTTSSHQLSSGSGSDDEILPLFKRIQLQEKKSDLTINNTVTHHIMAKESINQHVHGTLDSPIEID